MPPREVYDPKNPEPEFYNNHPPRVPPPPRTKSIFATKSFIIGYGIFLTVVVISITIYTKGAFNTDSFINKIINRNKTVDVKINKIDYFDNEITSTIEVKNINYTNGYRINNFIAKVYLYEDKNLIYSNEYLYNDVLFPKNQRIGFRITFNKDIWTKSNRVLVNLILDDIINVTNIIVINNINKSKN